MTKQSIYERVLEIPSIYKDQLSDNDLIAIVDNREKDISEEGIKIINQGRAARGGKSEALDVFGSILGGVASGAVGGLAAGPVGAIVGGITGGAIGAGAGSIIEDIRDDRDIDNQRALKEAAISAGTDAVTLGAFRIVKPLANKIGTSALKMFRGAEKPQPNRILDLEKATPESLQQTTNLGVELSAFQAGQAGARIPRWRILFEDLGEIGLFSKGVSEARKTRNFELIKQKMFDLAEIVTPDQGAGLTKNKLGKQVFDIITAGQAAMSKTYGDGLQKIIEETGAKTISTKRIRNNFLQLLNANRKGGDPLLPDIAKFLDKKITSAEQLPETMTASQLLDFRTLLNRELDDLIINPKTLNPDSAMKRQAAEINRKVREGIEETFGDFSVAAKNEAKRLNGEYKTALNKIMPPKISRSIIIAGAERNYKDIGQLLTKLTDEVDSASVKKFMNSIDRSMQEIDKAQITGNFKSAKKVKKAIRQGFLERQFGDFSSLNSMDSFKSLINDFNSADKRAFLTSVLGRDGFNHYKSYVNAIYESTRQNERGFLSLGLKARELSAFTMPFQAGAGLLAASGGNPLDFQTGASELTTAGLIFLSPVVMAKIATKPAAINRLIALDKQVRSGKELGAAAVSSSALKIFNEFDQEELQDIAEDLSSYN